MARPRDSRALTVPTATLTSRATSATEVRDAGVQDQRASLVGEPAERGDDGHVVLHGAATLVAVPSARSAGRRPSVVRRQRETASR